MSRRGDRRVLTADAAFADKPRPILDLLPIAPSRIPDAGAGIDVDAAALAEMGRHVVAVEPTDELRLAGTALVPSTPIERIADSLPVLGAPRAAGRSFDPIRLSAVWMRLDEQERRRAMPAISGMTRPDGRMIASLRHGPAPEGRRTFEATADDTIQLAEAHDLQPILRLEAQSRQPANRLGRGTRTRLAFSKER